MTDGAFRMFIMPHPRKIEEIFDADDLATLSRIGEVTLHRGDKLSGEDFKNAWQANVIMGQFDMPPERLEQCPNLRAVINLEGNFLPNIDYDYCFRHGIRVLTVSHVFAAPVAEIGLAMAIDLGRGITRSDRLMRRRAEKWGLGANQNALTLFDADVGFVGFGDLGKALLPLLRPFRANVKVFDPWLPDVVVTQAGCRPADLATVLSTSDYVFVLAGATEDNQGFLGKAQFDLMRNNAALLLLSRAQVVNFQELLEVARTGRIRLATDVFPTEPLPADDPARDIENIILSPHQAGALQQVLREIGKSVVADVALIARRLPPLVCKQAQPETAAKFRSKPVEAS